MSCLTQNEIGVCLDLIKIYNKIPKFILMRKLKCSFEHADLIIEKYILTNLNQK